MKYSALFDLKNKIAVVTGGMGLIGKELVTGLAEAGAITLLTDIKKDRSSQTAKRFTQSGLNVFFKYLDITKDESVSELIKFIDKRFGRLDIWVNNAYPRTKDWQRSLEEVKFASWKKNIDMHLNGYFICCKRVAEYMKEQGSGSIINIGSIYGMVGPDFSVYKDTKMTMPVAYSAIKGGIINLTRYFASYFGSYNIRVNCISTGGVYNNQPRNFVTRYTARTPLKRMAKPKDIVGAVIYLASEAAEYLTGQNIVVDGGWTAI